MVGSVILESLKLKRPNLGLDCAIFLPLCIALLFRRNRSGERRWDTASPYCGGQERGYYSSSLVSTYLSPPPESRWRRTSSDSALYQKLTASPQQGKKSSSEQGSPDYTVVNEDVKPSAELLHNLLLKAS